ncbi:hypothetical protein AGABI2DRAFT_201275 [Agaricus bisporus var. bisporus H97]|uniref:hypothetical protein n=1 Tax=Agaricus bisporus var. bisporus (strain H97 / ATCC MYA-4626 / FGSC 10389) TaxID=936046 RepID=UPI00029F7212|nr:hypothetical protein AGABI2DRAFT_201275 [Agaricus bisporus var. bisporus H97]EKV49164.1 hypothetical protein AGABI2DRAFT_201275 [Agaricus bisporus var. bisporus H97]
MHSTQQRLPSTIRPGTSPHFSSAPPTPPQTPLNLASTPGPSNSGRRSVPPSTPRTRARDLLRKHYGLGLGPPTPSGNPADPMNMDSTAFDAKSYYEQLITTSSLPALVKRENELVTEIRELDSERQSLVYNHHHELIAASETIAAMKSRAESLDSDLDLLRAAFSEISRLAAEVSTEPEAKTTTPESRSD